MAAQGWAEQVADTPIRQHEAAVRDTNHVRGSFSILVEPTEAHRWVQRDGNRA